MHKNTKHKESQERCSVKVMNSLVKEKCNNSIYVEVGSEW